MAGGLKRGPAAAFRVQGPNGGVLVNLMAHTASSKSSVVCQTRSSPRALARVV